MFSKVILKAMLLKIAITFAVGAAMPKKAYPAVERDIQKTSATESRVGGETEIKQAIEQNAPKKTSAARSRIFKDTRVTVTKRGMTFSRQ